MQNIRLDLTNILWPDVECKCVYFTHENSFIQNGIRYTGVVTMDLDSVLLPETSAQKSEVKTLIQALELAKGAIDNIYTDSRWNY